MKCNDCGGSGQYQGIFQTDTCKTCNGTGEVTVVVPDALPLDLHIDTGLKEGRRPMVPVVGERIYYYVEDTEGTITVVNEINQSFEATFNVGRGHGSFRDLVWNVTQNRWEIIRTNI